MTGATATPRSRCWPRPSICRARSMPFADVRLARTRIARGSGGAASSSRSVPMISRRRRQLSRAKRATGWPLDRTRWHAGALRRPAACGRRRRSSCRSAAPRRTHARRQPRPGTSRSHWRRSRARPFGTMAVPGDVTVTRQVLAEPEAGLASARWASARRRNATRHRGEARQGPGRAVPRDRRRALVEPPAVGQLRRHAAAGRRIGGDRCDQRNAAASRREVVPPTRVLDGFGAFGPPPAKTRPVPVELCRARHFG